MNSWSLRLHIMGHIMGQGLFSKYLFNLQAVFFGPRRRGSRSVIFFENRKPAGGSLPTCQHGWTRVRHILLKAFEFLFECCDWFGWPGTRLSHNFVTAALWTMNLSSVLASVVIFLPSAFAAIGSDGYCRADNCNTTTNEECTFTVKVNLLAGELGYYQFEECGDLTNPTIGIEMGKTYRFLQVRFSSPTTRNSNKWNILTNFMFVFSPISGWQEQLVPSSWSCVFCWWRSCRSWWTWTWHCSSRCYWW